MDSRGIAVDYDYCTYSKYAARELLFGDLFHVFKGEELETGNNLILKYFNTSESESVTTKVYS